MRGHRHREASSALLLIRFAFLCLLIGSCHAGVNPNGFWQNIGASTGVSSCNPMSVVYWMPSLPAQRKGDNMSSIMIVMSDVHSIARYMLNNTFVLSWVGTAGASGADATHFNNPTTMAIDDHRDVAYVTDTNNNCIRAVKLSAWPTSLSTLAGSCGGTAGTTDGLGSAAAFNAPTGLALDASRGVMYVTDYSNNCIRKVTYGGRVTTLFGTCNALLGSTVLGLLSTAAIYQPQAIVLASDKQTLFVTGSSDTIYKVTATQLSQVSNAYSSITSIKAPSDTSNELLLITTDNSDVTERIKMSDGSAIDNDCMHSMAVNDAVVIPSTSPLLANSVFAVVYDNSGKCIIQSKFTYTAEQYLQIIKKTKSTTRSRATYSSTTSNSQERSKSRSVSGDRSDSSTHSTSNSGSFPRSQSQTDSNAKTTSFTPSRTGRSATGELTGTNTRSSSFERTPSSSPSKERSSSVTQSKTLTRSHTPPPTKTKTGTQQKSKSVSITPPPTHTRSSTKEKTQSWSQSPTRSSSQTESPTFSDSSTRTASETSERTRSFSGSLSRTPSVTFTRSPSASRSSSSTDTRSMPLTTSPQPPTTTEVPTRTATVPTSCPDCRNGTCQVSVVTRIPLCSCYSDFNRGFWVGGRQLGEPCIECQAYFFGAGCLRICPGGLCTPCNGHGVCDDGVAGTGLCTCYNGTQGLGTWTGSACDECAAGFYNTSCQNQCQCGNRGACFQGKSGNGSCVCDTKYTGATCSACAPGYWGFPNCSACLPSAANACNGHGQCNVLDGNCFCDVGYSGDQCQDQCAECLCKGGHACVSCPSSCSNVGDCDNTTGVCSCPSNTLGNGCQYACPRDAGGVVCSGHGTCVMDSFGTSAICSCYSSPTKGYFTGTICDQCQAAYASTNCTIPCPLGSSGDPCSLSGTCMNGKCTCLSAYCGTPCDLLASQCGACNSTTLWGASCEHRCTCVHGTCSNGRTGDGNCACSAGWAGVSCNIPCSGNINGTIPCTGHGVCDSISGRCTCSVGWANVNCSVSCKSDPVTGALCYGNGVCNYGSTGDGTCSCYPGYVSVKSGCSTLCSCKSSVYGTCNEDGSCTCNGNYGGVDCASCQLTYSGNDCNTRCTNGVTNGTRCLCYAGYGGPGCHKQCGSSAAGLCSGHGVCGYGDLSTGACACSSGWIGPSCNCSSASCVTYFGTTNGECDADTGMCVCQTRWGGAHCTDCSRLTWGPQCTEVCRCGHGYCQRDTGTCVCDSDSNAGYWSGNPCSQCADGFFGDLCTLRSIYATQLPSFTVNVPRTAANFYSAQISKSLVFTVGTANVTSPLFPGGSQVLPNNGSLLVGGTTMAQLLEATVQIPRYQYSMLAKSYLPCAVSSPLATWGSLGKFWVLNSCSDGSYTISSQIATLPITDSNATQLVARITPLSSRTFTSSLFFVRNVKGRVVIPSDVSPEDGDNLLAAQGVPTLCVINDVSNQGVANYYEPVCFTNATSLGFTTVAGASSSTSFPFTFANPSALVYVQYPYDVVLALGVDDTGTCVGYSFPPEKMPSSPPSYSPLDHINDNQVGTCTSVDTAVVVNGTWLVVAIQRAGQSRIMRSRLYDNTWESPSLETPAVGHTAIGMTVDRLTSIVYVVLNQASTAYFIKVECTASSFTVLGSQNIDSQASDDRRASAVALAENARLIFVLQRLADGVAVRRFIVYDVTAISPTISDRRGGTNIVVTGRGFAVSAGTTPQCRIGSAVVNATVLSTTQVVCTTVATTISPCAQEEVAVGLFGGIFTINKVYLARYDAPTISTVAPAIQHHGDAKPVTVSGIGFFQSTNIACKYSAAAGSVSNSTRVIVKRYVRPYPHHTRTMSRSLTQPRSKTVSFSINMTATVSTSQSLSKQTKSKHRVVLRRDRTLTRSSPFAPTPAPTAAPTTSGTSFQYYNGTVYLLVGGFYDATTGLVICDAASAITQAFNGYIDVALDGSVYTGNPSPIIFVGAAAGVLMSYTQLSLTVAASVKLPDLTVTFIDTAGNDVGTTFTDDRLVNITLLTSLVSFDGGVTTAIEAHEGVGSVTFTGLTITKPKSITTTLLVQAAPIYYDPTARIWTASAAVTFNQGPLAQIVVVQQPSTTIDDQGKLASKPQINLLDIANNQLGPSSTGTLAYAYLVEVQDAVDVPAAVIAAAPAAQRDKNFTATCLSGSCSFDDPIDHVSVRGGFAYYFYLWVVNPSPPYNQIAVTTVTMYPSCPQGQYRTFGSYQCTTCIANAICSTSGTVSLQPGYWRSGPYSQVIQACVPPEACLGGNLSSAASDVCAVGYEGPMCGSCSPGYGRSIGSNCNKCPSVSQQVGLFILVVVLVFAFLVIVIVLSAQNWRVATSTVVVLQLLVSHLQTVVSVGEIAQPYPDFFEQAIAWVSVGAEFRVLDISFADCVMRQANGNFLDKFAIFAAAPVLALMAAGVAWVILFVNPEFLRFRGAGSKKSHRFVEQYERRREHRAQQKILKRFEALRGPPPEVPHPSDPRHKESKERAKQYELDKKEYLEQRQHKLSYSIDPEQARIMGLQQDFQGVDEEDTASHVLSRSDYKFLAVTSLQVVMFFTFPTAVAYSVTMQQCVTVSYADGTTKDFLKIDMSISCNDKEYLVFRNVAQAVAVILLAGLPLGYCAAYWFHRLRRHDKTLERRQLFSFLLQGLKTRVWFWPAVLLIRKGLLKVCVVSIFSPADGWVALWILLLYLPALYKFKPYTNDQHTFLDAVGVAVDVLALNLNYLLTVAAQKDYNVRVAIATVSLTLMMLVAVLFLYKSTAYPRWVFQQYFRERVLKLPTTEFEETAEEQRSPSLQHDALASPEATQESADRSRRNHKQWLFDRLKDHGFNDPNPLASELLALERERASRRTLGERDTQSRSNTSDEGMTIVDRPSAIVTPASRPRGVPRHNEYGNEEDDNEEMVELRTIQTPLDYAERQAMAAASARGPQPAWKARSAPRKPNSSASPARSGSGNQPSQPRARIASQREVDVMNRFSTAGAGRDTTGAKTFRWSDEDDDGRDVITPRYTAPAQRSIDLDLL